MKKAINNKNTQMEEMKYYLSTEINAQNKLFTEICGTYDFESAIKSVMKKFDLLTEEEVRRAFEDVFGYSISHIKLEEKVADLNCYCDGCIEEVFDASDDAKVFGIVLTDKNEVVKAFYDIASHSVVIEDMEGEELYTTLEDFTEDFIKFCTEKFGEEYTQYWAA